MKRVLLLLDGTVLFGRERGNIDVLQHLNEQGFSVMVAVHDHWGRQHIVPHLKSLDIPWCELDFYDRLGRDTTLFQWLIAVLVIAKANVQLALRLLRTPTSALQISNPETLLNFLPLLWLIRKTLILRCGDTPASHTAAHRWLWRVCFRRVNRVVAISEHIAGRLRELGCPEKKLTIIWSRPFNRQPSTVRRFPAERAGPVFGFMGQLERHKGIDHLLEACAALHDEGVEFTLRVAGRPGECWQALAKRYEAAPWLFFEGFVDDAASFYAGIDLLVVPSVFEEGLGAVVIEAKKAGVASLVYPRGGLPELISPEIDGLICETPEVASLLVALRQLSEAPSKLAAMGEAARRSSRDIEQAFEAGWSSVYAL
ncbi:MAG: glycosyltransferase family 4 protein [Pseudomonadota bacterium]